MTRKEKVGIAKLVVRMLLTPLLLWGVWVQAGCYTAVCLFLLFAADEIRAYGLRRHQQTYDAAIKLLNLRLEIQEGKRGHKKPRDARMGQEAG